MTRLLLLSLVLLLVDVTYAESTLDKARNEGMIRVGFANEAPYSFMTTEGVFTGESPEVFRYVMQQLGIPRVEGVLTEWGSLIPGLQAGRFDAIVASMYVTPRRCRQIIFSNPTYGIDEAFIVYRGNPKAINTYQDAVDKKAKLALVAGTAEMAQARLAGVSRLKLVVVPDFAAAAAAVKSKRADAAALTALTAKQVASKEDQIDHTEPFTFTHGGKPYRSEGAFGFRKEDSPLRDAVNGVLAEFIGSEAHQSLVAPFGFDASNLPKMTAAELCKDK